MIWFVEKLDEAILVAHPSRCDRSCLVESKRPQPSSLPAFLLGVPAQFRIPTLPSCEHPSRLVGLSSPHLESTTNGKTRLRVHQLLLGADNVTYIFASRARNSLLPGRYPAFVAMLPRHRPLMLNSLLLYCSRFLDALVGTALSSCGASVHNIPNHTPELKSQTANVKSKKHPWEGSQKNRCVALHQPW